MARTIRLLALGSMVFVAWAGACAAQKGTTSPEEPGQETGEAEVDGEAMDELASGESESASDDSGARDTSAGGAKAAASDDRQNGAVVACGKMCDAVAKKCNENDERLCRASCDKYDVVPDECQSAAIAAFDCGRKAEDLLCASVASPSCAHLFETMASCATLGRVDKKTDYKAPVPSGWKRVKDGDAGFSVHMPPGAKREKAEARRVWVATDSEGVVYRAEWFPAPAGRNVDARLLAAAKQFLKECTGKLKIHGRWDQPDHSGASFAGQCKDGKGWKGTVRLRDEAVYALGMQGSDPKQGAYEGFVYSFEFTK